MRRILFLYFSLVFYASGTLAQEHGISPFLFEENQNAVIIYKDGRQFSVPLNYNLIIGKYLFFDTKDQQMKEFSEPELIGIIRIGNRSFIPTDGQATEIIQVDPQFYVTYSGNLRNAPKNITYGGTTQTASVDNYSSLIGKGVISGATAQNKIVSSILKTYEVKIGKKHVSFYNKKSYIKIWPKEKRKEIAAYIETQDIDFDVVKQVLNSYNHILHTYYLNIK